MSLQRVDARFWRMLAVQWQKAPFDSGSHLIGGRFNRPGTKALYLSADHTTAIAEFHQLITRPGTLVGYDVQSDAIVDLSSVEKCAAQNIDPKILANAWYDMMDRGEEPLSWQLADTLRAQGAVGIFIPSFQSEGTDNLVLWRWHRSGTPGDGAAITLVDPGGELLP